MPKEASLNSSMPWIKLWTEFPDDPKLRRCSEGSQLLFLKLLALAGQCDAEGYLVNGDAPLLPEDIAWRLRIEVERTEGLIDELLQAELLENDEGYLLIPNFSKRQGRSQMQKRAKWAERQQRHRAKMADVVTGDNENVTGDNDQCHANVTLPEGEGEGEGEKRERRGRGPSISLHSTQGEPAAPVLETPTTPKEAMRHPDIQIFREVSGRIPGIRDYELVIQTVQLLRQKVPEEAALLAYLGPFWVAWSGRKTRDGRPYDTSSLVWLTEWAVNGQIPPAHTSGNGKGPPKEYTAAQKKAAAQEEYQRQKKALEAQNADTDRMAD